LDFDASLRWFRGCKVTTLSRRDDRNLPFIKLAADVGPTLLLDTCVYIDQLQGKTPEALDDLFQKRRHSMIAIQELMHLIGRLDPGDRRTADVVKRIGDLIRSMPAHRIFAPDPDTLAKAALLAGLMCRLLGYAEDKRRKALHDCILFIQAQKSGFVLLSRNIVDFDYMLQLWPEGRVLMYRQR
jgi:hypothetical protein